MANALLGVIVGLIAALASTVVPGISVLETCAIYMGMCSATLTLSVISRARPNTQETDA